MREGGEREIEGTERGGGGGEGGRIKTERGSLSSSTRALETQEEYTCVIVFKGERWWMRCRKMSGRRRRMRSEKRRRKDYSEREGLHCNTSLLGTRTNNILLLLCVSDRGRGMMKRWRRREKILTCSIIFYSLTIPFVFRYS